MKTDLMATLLPTIASSLAALKQATNPEEVQQASRALVDAIGQLPPESRKGWVDVLSQALESYAGSREITPQALEQNARGGLAQSLQDAAEMARPEARSGAIGQRQLADAIHALEATPAAERLLRYLAAIDAGPNTGVDLGIITGQSVALTQVGLLEYSAPSTSWGPGYGPIEWLELSQKLVDEVGARLGELARGQLKDLPLVNTAFHWTQIGAVDVSSGAFKARAAYRRRQLEARPSVDVALVASSPEAQRIIKAVQDKVGGSLFSRASALFNKGPSWGVPVMEGVYLTANGLRGIFERRDLTEFPPLEKAPDPAELASRIKELDAHVARGDVPEPVRYYCGSDRW